MSSTNRSLGLAALGWWLAARGLCEPIEESFFRLDPAGVQKLGKASRLAILAATRKIAAALRAEPTSDAPTELFAIGASWLDRLDTVLNTPRIGLRLEKALVGDSEDFAALIESDLTAEDRSLMMAARLAEWLRGQVGEGEGPAALAVFLAEGWPIQPGSNRYVTFAQEFLACFRDELADATSEITAPLGEPSEFLGWLANESAPRVVEQAPETALELPPPTPAAPPAPRLDLAPGESMPSAIEEPAPPQPAKSEEATLLEPTPAPPTPAPSPAQPVMATVPVAVLEQAERERTSFRRWALAFQLTWVVLLVLAWRFYQDRRSTLPAVPTTTATATASPGTATPTSIPASHQSSATPPLSTPPPLPPEMSVAPNELNNQATALANAGHHAEAAAIFRRIVQLQAQDKTINRLPRALVYARMASSLAALERWDEADASVERAQALLEELLPTHDAETALGLEMVADYWASRERWPLAARLYQKAVQTYQETEAENSLQQMSALNRYAGALRQLGEVKMAEKYYRQLVNAFAGGGGIVATEAASASHNLANVLFVTNRAGEALKYYEEAFSWLAKVPNEDLVHAKRMAILMQDNYERCLTATGIPATEATERARKILPGRLQ